MGSSERKSAGVFEPTLYTASVMAVVVLIVLTACAELCDGVTVVDVYRLVQYDLAGVPFGSRIASLNHHAASSLFSPGSSGSGSSGSADLSRTVLILPLRELNLTLIRGMPSLSI